MSTDDGSSMSYKNLSKIGDRHTHIYGNHVKITTPNDRHTGDTRAVHRFSLLRTAAQNEISRRRRRRRRRTPTANRHLSYFATVSFSIPNTI